MHPNKISPKHSEKESPGPVPVNDNQGGPQQTRNANLPTVPPPGARPLVRQIWVPALIVVALGLTAVWTIFLGFQFVSLIGRAF